MQKRAQAGGIDRSAAERSFVFQLARAYNRRRKETPMFKRILNLVALTCLVAVTLWAADDPFLGKWKLNIDKSQITGEQMKIQDLGNNKYTISWGATPTTIIADGTDQPDRYGGTVSIAPEGANAWKMVVKKDGKVVDSMTHTLSADGKTQTIKGTAYKPDGATSDFETNMKRVGSGSGWGGTWESTDVKFTSPDEWEISAYEGGGLTFTTPAYKEVLSMKFDGKDYEDKGPNVAPGSMASGKRVDTHNLEVTNKVKGEVMDHTKFRVSSDSKTLTLTIKETGQPNPITLVYDRI